MSKKLQQPTTPEDVKKIVRAMLANMCGDKDRTDEIAGYVELDRFPQDLTFERDMLRVYHDLSMHALPPTRDAVVQGLISILGYKPDVAAKGVDNILTYATVGRLVRMEGKFFRVSG
jgi:hypothetical protein